MENELKTIVATRVVPAELTITYDDMHGLWGGTTITVRGDGALETQTREIGAREADISHKQIDERELISLIKLLVELRGWEQVTAEVRPVPDESRAYLALSLNDKSTRVWERVNEMAANNRLTRIKNFLESLMRASTVQYEDDRHLYSPRQLPDLEGDSLTLTWDQIDADSIITHEDKIVWRERTGWEVYDRFEEITEILHHRYGRRIIDIVPTERSLYALYGDSSRASFHVTGARESLKEALPDNPFPQFYWLMLEEAIRKGDSETVRKYLARGGDPNTRSLASGSSDTPLHIAARHRQVEIARMFIAAGADANATAAFEKPPLVDALDTRFISAARPRGGGFRVDPEHLRIEQTTALVKLFVQAGANLSGLNRPFSELTGLNREMYEPPLSVAAKYGYADALRFLIEQGAEIDVEDYFGDTPLITALRCGQPEPALILIAAGADVRRLPNSQNQVNETQLLMVVRSLRFNVQEKVDLIGKLVQAGADVNSPDATGDTPLIKAVRLGTDFNYAIMGFGTEPNVEWRVTKSSVNKKWSPQDVAALVSALLATGVVDSTTRDRDGKTAREIASDAGLTEVSSKL
jgi:ankyrin repeat protein